jgi:hypothetical protein
MNCLKETHVGERRALNMRDKRTDRNISAGKSMRSGVLCEAVGVLAAGLLVAGSAFGIGPDYQITYDTFNNAGAFLGAPVGSLNDTCALSVLTTNNVLDQQGSGTVIGIQVDPTNTNMDDVAILTANHVATLGIAAASFGIGISAPAAQGGYGAYALTLPVVAFTTYTLVDPLNNPNNLPEDMSILEAQVTPAALANPGPAASAYNAYAKSEWGLVAANVINPVAWPSPIPAPSAPASNVNTFAAGVPFSISGGYGLGSQYNGNIVPQYPSNKSEDVRRFMNGTVTTTLGASVKNEGGYFEPNVGWPGQAPSAGGGGAALGGDSGSGYLVNTNFPVSLTVTNVDNLNSSNAIPSSITLSNTTDVGADEWGGKSMTVGLNDYGVPLVSGQSLAWAQLYAASPWLIPEPDSLVLTALGGISLLLLRYPRRRTRRVDRANS